MNDPRKEDNRKVRAAKRLQQGREARHAPGPAALVGPNERHQGPLARPAFGASHQGQAIPRRARNQVEGSPGFQPAHGGGRVPSQNLGKEALLGRDLAVLQDEEIQAARPRIGPGHSEA
jgi:hypothetical protein